MKSAEWRCIQQLHNEMNHEMKNNMKNIKIIQLIDSNLGSNKNQQFVFATHV